MADQYWMDPDREEQALAEADQRRRQASQLDRQVTPEMGQRAVDLLGQNPNLSAGLLQALVQSGADDEQAAAAAQQDDGGLLGSVADVAGDVVDTVTQGAEWALDGLYEQAVKPTLRGLFTASEGLYRELVERPVTSAAATFQGEAESFGQAYEDYGDSALVNAVQNVTDDDPDTGFDLGTGFFAGGQVGQQTQDERQLTIRGETANIGQAFANGLMGQFQAPGDQAYDIVAGVSQFAAEVGLDPLAWGTAGASKVVTAARTLDTGAAVRALRQADEVAYFDDVQRTRIPIVRNPDPAVAAADNLPAQYHGTASQLRGLTPDDPGSTNNIFGPGFYTTDNPDVAASYMEKGRTFAQRLRGERGSVHNVRWTGEGSPAVLNLSDVAPRQMRDRIRQRVDEIEADELRDYEPERLQAVREALDDPSASGESVYTSFRKFIWSAARDEADILDETVDLNAGLRDEGWDVLRYQGGARRGDVEHNAHVWLDPNNIEIHAAPEAGPVVTGWHDVERTVGAIDGERRRAVLVDKARNFFGSERILQRLAESDAYDIMQSWSRSPANRLDIDTIRDLGDATDQAGVAEVLFNSVARGEVTRKGFYSGMGNFAKRNLVQSQSRFTGPFRYFTAEGKLSGLSPRGQVSADDLGDSAGKLDSLLRQANVDRDVRAGIFNRVSHVTPHRFDELFDVTTDAINEVAKKVDGRADTSLNDIARDYRHQLEDMRSYGVDSWGGDLNVPYARRKIVQNFDGEEVETIVPTPQITSELNSMALHLPDVHDIRRAATQNRVMRTVYTNKGWKTTANSTRWITRQLFKPLAILRPAYIVRIGAEEQARLTAAHHDSLISHPWRFIQANILNRNAMQDLVGGDLAAIARTKDVIAKDALGIVDDMGHNQARIFSTVRRGRADEELSDRFVTGWRQELGQLSAAPEARQLAALRGNIDEFKTWAQSEGREHIERIARVNDEADDLLRFGSGFDEWADGLRRRIEAKTAGWDEDLVGRIVSGDIPLEESGRAARTAQAGFANMLRGKGRQGRAPARVKAEFTPEGMTRARNRAVDGAFDLITGKPTSYLARFPAFRQSIIRRTADMMDSMASDGLRSDALEAATRNMGLTRKEARTLSDAASNARGSVGPIEDINMLNDLAVNRSADDVKDLLFDITRRGAGQDALEVVFPFLDAFKEVSRTWSRMVKENPAFFVRAQAGYRSLSDQGFFHTNDFGDEVFSYPGGGALSAFVERLNASGGQPTDIPGAALGAVADTVTGNTPDYSVNLEGRVEGLNLVAQGTGPGFGPVVQWGAELLQSPDLDRARSFLAPFGTGLDEPSDLADPGAVLGTLAPAWARKAVNGFLEGAQDERQWNSTVGDAMKALATSGDYSPDDQDRLLEDAQRFGQWLLFTRSATQFAGPTGPSASVEVGTQPQFDHGDWNPDIDPQGTTFSTGVLMSDYFRLMQTYGPDEAATKFYELYGVEPFWISQAKTDTSRELPVDAEGNRWMRRNEEVVDDFPSVAGFFAPTDEDAELDFSVYSSQIERGERQSLTPRQQQELANKSRARAMYDAVKRRAEGLPDGQRERLLSTTQGRLEELYPGWQAPVLGLEGGLRLGDRIAELERAAFDERLADEPATEPTRVYLRLRQRALETANDRGLKTLQSDRMADVKSGLEQAGMTLRQRYPSFTGVWSGLLRREVS